MIEAVLATAISAAGTAAVSCESLAKLVASALPFQFTTEAGTNPFPLTVSVNSGPPGAMLAGTRG